MNDVIDRQVAIDALRKMQTYKLFSGDDMLLIDQAGAQTELMLLPPAEPQIIRCKDCKHFVRDDIEEHTPYGFYNTYFRAFCNKHWDKEQGEYIDVNLDDYCSFAERREVTE